MSFEVTPEHEAIYAHTDSGASLAVLAGAGTGKTATAVEITKRAPNRRTLYLAFNKPVADQARRRFPGHVTSKTAHALAFAAVGHQYKERISTSIWDLRSKIEDRFTPHWIANGGHTDTAKVAALATIATIVAYCQTADDDIAEHHVPESSYDASVITKLARMLWRSIIDPSSTIPVLHDFYLKLYQLSKPRIPIASIIYDEAQDANGAMLDIVLRQTAQLIFIGDPAQAIYGWRGATDAFDAIHLPRLPLSASWRFGQDIANIANFILDTRPRTDHVRMIGRGGPSSVIRDSGSDGHPNVYLSRSNSGLIGRASHYARQGARISIPKGIDQICAWSLAAFDLWKYGNTRHPAFSFFGSWNDLCEAAGTQLGAPYRQYVELVQANLNDVPEIIHLITARAVPQETADIILSTVHTFKGSEGHHVRLGDDFSPFCSEKQRNFEPTGIFEYDVEEANLAYVAVTRARGLLELGGYAGVLVQSLENARRMAHRSLAEAPGLPLDLVLPTAPTPVAVHATSARELALDYAADPVPPRPAPVSTPPREPAPKPVYYPCFDGQTPSLFPPPAEAD